MDDNCGEWVECIGVVVRRWVWLVGVGGIYGCGCKEVYRFPHTTYPYSSCIYIMFFFAAASLLFVHFLKCFSFSNYIDFLILLIPIIILLLYVLFFCSSSPTFCSFFVFLQLYLLVSAA